MTLRNPETSGWDGENPFPFAIRFMDGEGETLGMVPDMLEGEACWIVKHIRERNTE